MSQLVSLANLEFTVHSLGERAIALRPTAKCEDDLRIPLIGERIHASEIAGVEDVVATSAELLIVHDAAPVDEMLKRLSAHDFKSAAARRQLKLPILFDEHDDWGAVSRHTGLDRGRYIDNLVQQEFRVAMYGFVPGFVYMGGLPKTMWCPRKETPDKKAPAGSVAIGGPYIGVYSLESPAGWHVLGGTPIRLHDIPNMPPMHLRIGDAITPVAIDKDEFSRLANTSMNILQYND